MLIHFFNKNFKYFSTLLLAMFKIALYTNSYCNFNSFATNKSFLAYSTTYQYCHYPKYNGFEFF